MIVVCTCIRMQSVAESVAILKTPKWPMTANRRLVLLRRKCAF